MGAKREREDVRKGVSGNRIRLLFFLFFISSPTERKALDRYVGETTTEAIDTEQEWLGSDSLSVFPNWEF